MGSTQGILTVVVC